MCRNDPGDYYNDGKDCKNIELEFLFFEKLFYCIYFVFFLTSKKVSWNAQRSCARVKTLKGRGPVNNRTTEQQFQYALLTRDPRHQHEPIRTKRPTWVGTVNTKVVTNNLYSI